MAAQVTADVVATQLEAIAKKKPLPKLFHWNDVFFSQIAQRKDVVVSSRELRVPQKIRPGSRFGFANMAGGTMGRGTSTKYDKATLTPIAVRVAVEINQDVLDQTDGEPKSILNILAENIADMMKEMRVQMNASLQTAGDGVLGTITALPGANVFTLGGAPFYTQLLREGQKVSVYDSALTTKRGECEVVRIDHENNNVTMDSTPGGTITTDVLLPEGVSGATPAWFFGIPYHHSNSATGTWEGYNRATEPNIRANRVNGNGNALTTPPIRLALSKILQRVGQVNPKALKAHLHTAQKAAYEELGVLNTSIDKGSGNEDLDLFFGEVRMAGCPTVVDIHAARNRIDFINLDTWGKAETKPVDFFKTPDGRYYTRPVSTVDGSPVAALLFYIYWFGQFFTDLPAALAYIDNLAIPAGFSAM